MKKSEKLQKNLCSCVKKNSNIQPVVIEGRTLASTWWGKAWNKNLESYADYSNRVGRGKTYVRHGAVLDLKITEGKIVSLVQGGRSSPYKITINIEPLDNKKWKKIQTECQGKFESLQPLLNGKFPKTLEEVFTNHDSGLFPSPSEISFQCSCPDWASMCKHVAATLYGVGARLDSEPELFFKLRKVKMDDLIIKVIEGKKNLLLNKAKNKSSRILNDSDLSSLFGIEMEDIEPFIKKKNIEKKETGL